MTDADEISMFGATAARALRDLSPLEEMRGRLQVGAPLVRKTWAAVVELGWSGICIPEELGGHALDVRYLCALGEAIGRSLAVGPFAANMALAPALPAFGVDEAMVGKLLPAIASGETVLTGSCGLAAVTAIDYTSVANWALLIRLHPAGEAILGEGNLIDLSLPGVLGEEVGSFDPTRQARKIALHGASPGANRVFTFELRRARMDEVLLPLRLFTASQAVGVAQRALELAIEHVTARQQFGRPLGSFQAIKHQLADVHVMNEKARVLTQFAANEAAAGVADAYLDSHLAWIAAIRAAIGASQSSLQLHGASGFAWEHPCHLFLKRARSLAASFAGVVGSRELVGQYVKDRPNFTPSHM